MQKFKEKPRDFEFGTIPDVACSFADGKVIFSFIRSEPRFFFTDFPQEGHCIPVPTKEIVDAIACLKDMLLASGKKG